MSRTAESEYAIQRKAGEESESPDLEAEHDPAVSRRASRAGLQRAGVHAAADRALATPTTALPHADRIQASFGPDHDVSGIQAHVGASAVGDMGATAFASGNHVAFEREPDLHTAAHEAAHVVQQAQGVNLYGGVGEAGDSYEQNADAVADRVVAGQSAADLLGGPTSQSAGGGGVVQQKAKPVTAEAAAEQHDTATHESQGAVQNALIMGAARIRGYAKSIREMINGKHDDEAGASRDVQEMQFLWELKDSELERLTRIVRNADSPGRYALEASRLYSAVFDFDRIWSSAKSFAERNSEKLIGAAVSHHPELERMFDAIGINTPSWKGDSHVDQRSDDVLRAASIKQNTLAATELTESIDMAIAVGNTSVVGTDFPRLMTHLQEIAKTLSEVDSKTLRGFKRSINKLRKQTHMVMHQVNDGVYGNLTKDTRPLAWVADDKIGKLINGR